MAWFIWDTPMSMALPSFRRRRVAFLAMLAPFVSTLVGAGGPEIGTPQGDGIDPQEASMLCVSPRGGPPGARVVVEGTLAEASSCMQGITIAVRKIEPR